VATREGVFRIQAIRNSLSELLNREDAAATARSTSAKREARRAVLVGIAALVAMGAMLVAFGFFLARGIARPVRNVAAAASRVATGDLSTRLPERGAAELQQLTTAFNAMARSLEQGKRELESQNEQLRQSERLKSELVSIVSHELRTPLASIVGFTELLLLRDPDADVRTAHLKTVHAEARRLAELIDDFLDLQRLAERGRLPLERRRVDLRPIVSEQARVFAAQSAAHSLAVRMPEQALVAEADPSRLKQVLANLLSNAIKYSPDGGEIAVEGWTREGVVGVTVSDPGLGIPSAQQPRVFERFYRAPAAAERAIGGTGLGLALSREIVEAHEGTMGFESVEGQGSRFWFELPAAAGGSNGSSA
jgi:signal transduction histidine kinase